MTERSKTNADSVKKESSITNKEAKKKAKLASALKNNMLRRKAAKTNS